MKEYKTQQQKKSFYKSAPWQSLRLKVLERDNYECQECKRNGRVDLYTCSYFYNHYLKPGTLNIDKSWLAAFPANPIKDQPNADFSNGKGAWQLASDYRFIGIGMNVYGISMFRRIMQGSTVPKRSLLKR